MSTIHESVLHKLNEQSLMRERRRNPCEGKKAVGERCLKEGEAAASVREVASQFVIAMVRDYGLLGVNVTSSLYGPA